MSGYIIHFDNETDLVHYGIKGMKWSKHKSAKIDYAKNRKRAFNERKYSFTQANINRLGNISKKEINKRYKQDKKSLNYYNDEVVPKKVMIRGRKVEDAGTNMTYDTSKGFNFGEKKMNKAIDKILNKRYNKTHAKKGKNIITKILAKLNKSSIKKQNHVKTMLGGSGWTSRGYKY